MNDPIKIIHKFKNNYKRVQYKIYIYIGFLVPSNIVKLLECIKDLTLYSTFEKLSVKNFEELEKYYGNCWYKYFFNIKHINKQIDIINKTKTLRDYLEKKFGKDWIKKNIVKEAPRINYSFSDSYYNYLLLTKKFKIYKKQEINFKTRDFSKYQYGGNNDYKNDYEDEIGNNSEDNIFNSAQDEDILDEINDENDNVIDEQLKNIYDIDELAEYYNKTTSETSNLVEISKLIGEAVKNKKWEEESQDLILNYDDKYDNILYDTSLEDTYNKYYITSQYIFKNDTIKILKNKICITIPLTNKFDNKLKLLPEYQYLWSEYQYEKTGKLAFDQIMIGQKWIKRNELLILDVVPNENITVYEDLKNNLKYLRDVSEGYKIKRENEESEILRCYINFITCNEIYLLDIYNELNSSINTESEKKKNLYDVYINIYYPLITYERFEKFLQLLNNSDIKEIEYNKSQFKTILVDSQILYEIEYLVENTRNLYYENYNKLFYDNYIIQTIIHVNINDDKNISGTSSPYKINLYRIFDNFLVNNDYPFICLAIENYLTVYKFYHNLENYDKNVVSKWFDTNNKGITFKIKIPNYGMSKKSLDNSEKFISVVLTELGKLEYKITWKEQDQATIVDIYESYNYIRKLLSKINSENKRVKIILPVDQKFRFAFINSIFKFSIPDKYTINHNDLSDFSRFFYNYVALVIEPKKRESVVKSDITTSKYGTYLRYKKINKYDDRIKLHLRIVYLLRNYDITDKELIESIAKQFNLTNADTANELVFVKEKYKKLIKKVNKIKKKSILEFPRTTPPGIGIDIQGKDRDNYKVRITGARDKIQLSEIIDFIQVLIYLYIQTYLLNKKEYHDLKKKLSKLTFIAQRCHKVMDIETHDSVVKQIKILTSLDKNRLGFRPEKGQNQWSRSCQNSGENNKRQPTIFTEASKLKELGFTYNSNTGFYEKTIKTKHITTPTVIRAIELMDDNNNSNYYYCDPNINKDNIHIGFLSKGNNPNNLCMPCCYKKDQLITTNEQKKNYFLSCLGKKENEETNIPKRIGQKIYILKETNKIQDGRFIFLPSSLDIFFNKLHNNEYVIENHYLTSTTPSGYYFKYTLKTSNQHFLYCLANIYNSNINTLKQNIIDYLNNPSNLNSFVYLNNGDIINIFNDQKTFIEYIIGADNLDYNIIGELVSLPNVISENGIEFYIFNKKTVTITSALSKNDIREEYYIDCLNNENYNLINKDTKDIIILIKDDNKYFPIYRIIKPDIKNSNVQTYYNKSNDGSLNNILDELNKYFSVSCSNTLAKILSINIFLTAKYIISILNINEIKIKLQYIDETYKSKYILLENGLFLPTSPSGISYIYNFEILNYKNIKKLNFLPISLTLKLLKPIEKILKLDYKITTIYYSKRSDKRVIVVGIGLKNKLTIPVKDQILKISTIKKFNIQLLKNVKIEKINYIISRPKDKLTSKKLLINADLHNNETYNLYRLELSLYLENNPSIKQYIIELIRHNSKIDVVEKKNILRLILFEILDKKLSNEYKQLVNQSLVIKHPDINSYLAVIGENIPDLAKYKMNNIREFCNINKTQDTCNINSHCRWNNNSCYFYLTEGLAIIVVNKVIEEMIQNGIKFKELIQENEYHVSDIVDNKQYSYRDKQVIIKSSNIKLQQNYSNIFTNKTKLLEQKISKVAEITAINKNITTMTKIDNKIIQGVISHQDSIIRAYINCYYWINNPFFNIEARNLGHYSQLQTRLTYLLKTRIIDFIQDTLNRIIDDEHIYEYLKFFFPEEKNFYNSFLNKFKKSSSNTDGKIELYVLSHLIDLPIVVYNNYNEIIYIYYKGIIEISKENIKLYKSNKNSVHIQFLLDKKSSIPNQIFSIYYLR